MMASPTDLDYRRTKSAESITYGVDQFRIRHDISLSLRFITIAVCTARGVCAQCRHMAHQDQSRGADEFGASLCVQYFGRDDKNIE